MKDPNDNYTRDWIVPNDAPEMIQELLMDIGDILDNGPENVCPHCLSDTLDTAAECILAWLDVAREHKIRNN